MIYPGADTFRDSPRDQEAKPRPSEPRGSQRSPQGGGRPSGPERAASDAPRYVPYQSEPPDRQPPRTASEGPQYSHQPRTKHPPPVFGDLETQRRRPPDPLRSTHGSPPPRRPGSNHSGGRRRDSIHDTARSRLDDRANRDGLPYAPGRRPPEHHRAPPEQNWERRRVTLYRGPQSRSSPSSNNSMRTAHPAARPSRHHGRRDPGGRSHTRSHAGDSHNSKQVAPVMAKIQDKKTGLEKFVTPLRLGLLLGCFDMIGGSLSAWMTYKRFGAAAQAAEVAKQAAIQQQEIAQSSGRSRSKRRPWNREAAPEYDEVSESDSEYDERQRRVAEHIMDQQRLERGRSRR